MAVLPLTLARELIRRPSVTPADAGALEVLISALEPLGFECHDLTFEEEGTASIRNLYARIGTKSPHLCFAGHTDVVPVGDAAAWSRDPFAADVVDEHLIGRGAADMKGAIACFVAAAAEAIDAGLNGSLSLMITGDEEGPAINGTRKVLDWLEARGETIDGCIVGEPTNPRYLGEMVKVGRRGSLNAVLTVDGVQGHVAYPDLADNPIPRLLALLETLMAPLDQGYENFQPSNLELTSIDVGNTTTNIIPARAQARFNVRFNPNHTGASLEAKLRRRLDRVRTAYTLDARVSGEAFLTESGALTATVIDAVEKISGKRPEASTNGGTSDARFIHRLCPVVECGLVGATMHRVDERVALSDLEILKSIYLEIIERFTSEATR